MSLDDDCFVPQHPRNSRPWLFRVPGHPTVYGKSITKQDFQIPTKVAQTTGRKRQLLERFFWQEICQQQQKIEEDEFRIEEYKTEYNSYDKSICKQDEAEKIKLAEKYPLYSHVSSTTFWKDNYKDLSCLTAVTTPLQPFRRNSAFSKPLSEVLDEPKNGL